MVCTPLQVHYYVATPTHVCMRVLWHVCARAYSVESNSLWYTMHTSISLGCYISYGVATISRFLKIIGLFCRIQSVLQGSFAKETYNLN